MAKGNRISEQAMLNKRLLLPPSGLEAGRHSQGISVSPDFGREGLETQHPIPSYPTTLFSGYKWSAKIKLLFEKIYI